MLYALLVTLHVIVSLILVLVVLLQTGKRADLAGAFGGGGSQTAFGARGAATFLSKATTGAAVLFMVTSLALSILSSKSSARTGSVLEEGEVPAATETVPTLPEEPAVPAPSSEAPPDEGETPPAEQEGD
jgi:preprotein translocase subunit SecG